MHPFHYDVGEVKVKVTCVWPPHRLLDMLGTDLIVPGTVEIAEKVPIGAEHTVEYPELGHASLGRSVHL